MEKNKQIRHEVRVVSEAIPFGGIKHTYENEQASVHPETVRRIYTMHGKLIEAGCAQRLETILTL